jgi:outer membrane protein OmpA-like peptidoglycan-associated protein
MKNKLLLTLILSLSQNLAAADDCDYAADLLYQAYDLRHQSHAFEREKALVESAVENCPEMPEAQNYYGSLLEKQGKYTQAIVHYKKAIALRPDFSQAWYGLGETYHKQERFPLSLEAHLHACQTDTDSKKRVVALLEDNRYTVTEKGKIIDRESLLVLYDKQRQKAIDQMLSDCDLGRLGRVNPAAVFRNFQFAPREADLEPGSEHQLEEIVAALMNLPNRVIKIHGHTDTQPFKDAPLSDSNRLNLELSEQRADTIARALTERGIPMSRIQTYGHGYHDPLVAGNDPSAWAQNRRVEIKLD